MIYADTSALAKLLKQDEHAEAEAPALRAWLGTTAPVLYGSTLLYTELYRLTHVRDTDGEQVVTVAAVDELLKRIHLLDVTTSLLRAAGMLANPVAGATLRSLDALHLAAALEIGCSSVLVYDKTFQAAVRHHGLTVLAPT